jgi:hypothetical protein
MTDKPIKVRARAVQHILVSPRVDQAGALLSLYLSDRTDIDLAISRATAVDLISRLRAILQIEDHELRSSQ